MQHLLKIEKRIASYFFQTLKTYIFSGRILSALNVRNTSWLKLIWFKFHEFCVIYSTSCECKKMQHFQNNVANNVVINLAART